MLWKIVIFATEIITVKNDYAKSVADASTCRMNRYGEKRIGNE
jgi:hypothetical protein